MTWEYIKITKHRGVKMPQSLSKIYVHVVFGTKHRVPWLIERVRPELYAFMAGSLKLVDSQPVRIGGMPDHTHLVFRLSKTYALSKVIERVKTDSSLWIKNRGQNFEDFAWQNGYGAFSIGQSGLDSTVRYVVNQQTHHQRFSFKEEMRQIFLAHQLEYNEKYFWE